MKKFAAMFVGVWLVLMAAVCWWVKAHTADDGHRTPLWSGEFWQGIGMLLLFLLLFSQIMRLVQEVRKLLPRSPWQRIRMLRSNCRELRQELKDTQTALADALAEIDRLRRVDGLLVVMEYRPDPDKVTAKPATATTVTLTPAAAQA